MTYIQYLTLITHALIFFHQLLFIPSELLLKNYEYGEIALTAPLNFMPYKFMLGWPIVWYAPTFLVSSIPKAFFVTVSHDDVIGPCVGQRTSGAYVIVDLSIFICD